MDTRTALLDAAEKAVCAHGHDGFSYSDLSAAVGIRKASIHHHFPHKSDLLIGLMQRYSTRNFEALAQMQPLPRTAADWLAGYVGHYRKGLHQGQTLCLCIALTMGRDRLDPALQSEIARFRSTSLDWLTQIFQTARSDGTVKGLGPADTEAAACLALVEGAQISARAGQDLGRFDAATALFRARLCNP